VAKKALILPGGAAMIAVYLKEDDYKCINRVRIIVLTVSYKE
jgi:hypothetical protein